MLFVYMFIHVDLNYSRKNCIHVQLTDINNIFIDINTPEKKVLLYIIRHVNPSQKAQTFNWY